MDPEQLPFVHFLAIVQGQKAVSLLPQASVPQYPETRELLTRGRSHPRENGGSRGRSRQGHNRRRQRKALWREGSAFPPRAAASPLATAAARPPRSRLGTRRALTAPSGSISPPPLSPPQWRHVAGTRRFSGGPRARRAGTGTAPAGHRGEKRAGEGTGAGRKAEEGRRSPASPRPRPASRSPAPLDPALPVEIASLKGPAANPHPECLCPTAAGAVLTARSASEPWGLPPSPCCSPPV